MDIVDVVTSKGVQYEIADSQARRTMLPRSELPKAVSHFDNDAGYIDKNVTELTNFYAKDESYSAEQVDGKLRGISDSQSDGLERERKEREEADSDLRRDLGLEARERQESDDALGRRIDDIKRDSGDTDARLQDETARRMESDDALERKLQGIQSVIPASVGEGNQLADKDFVNSSIATSTSHFIGTFSSLEALENQNERDVTPNDYAFVIRTDDDGNTLYDRYKYVGDIMYNIDDGAEGEEEEEAGESEAVEDEEEEGQWLYEYTLNNSSFTAVQWKAVNSGVTEEHVRKVEALQGLTVAQLAYLKAVIDGTEAEE